MNQADSKPRDASGPRTGRLHSGHALPYFFLATLIAILFWMTLGLLDDIERDQRRLEILDRGIAAVIQLENDSRAPGSVRGREAGRALAASLEALSAMHRISALTPQSAIARRSGNEELLAVTPVLVDGEAILRAEGAQQLAAAIHDYKASSYRLIELVAPGLRGPLTSLRHMILGLAAALGLGAAFWLYRRRPSPATKSEAEQLLEARRERRLEEPQRQDLQLFQTIIDSIDGGIVVFDADDRFLFCNAFYARMTQLPEALLQPGTEASVIFRYLGARNPANLGSATIEDYVQVQLTELRAPGEGTEFTVGEKVFMRSNHVMPNGIVIGLRTDITAVKRAQSQLRERSDLIDIALDAASDGLWDWNIEANRNYLSPRWKSLLGYADHEIGNSLSVWQAHIHPTDRDRVARAVEAHLDHKTPFDIEYRMEHRRDGWRWFRVRGQATFDPEGRPRRMAGFTTDIHESKMQALELERTRALLYDAIEALDAGIVRYDDEGRLVFCNGRFNVLYGFPPELSVPGATERALIEDFQSRSAGHLEAEVRERIVEQALVRMRVAGKPFDLEAGSRWLRVSASATADGGRVILTTDITRLKNTQAELTLAMNRAEAANVAKSQFLANMSHELRTPLNGVLGMLQVLESAGLDSPHDHHVELALRSGRSLLGLINDVLDLSRIQSGALTLEHIDFDLGDLIADALAPVSGAAGQKGLALQTRKDPGVPTVLKGDPTRLRQVLINLLGNALKFTEQGTITLGVSRLADGMVLRFEVTDTGIGIDAEQLGRIFDRFAQADTSITRRYGGAGLGLAISQQLVSAMGGTLNIESTVNVGTRLWFDLPFESGEARPVASPALAGDQPHLTGRVLVVDDAETNRLVAIAMLQQLGLDGDAVDSGETALAQVTALAPDLILMDCQMPTLDGFETTRQLQARLGTACPPIIALTANVGPRDHELARAAGMCDFVPKPIRLEVLKAALARWLPGARPGATGEAGLQAAATGALSPGTLNDLKQAFDAAGLERLFRTYLTSMENLLDRLASQLAAGDAVEVIQICHAMKGISGNVGAIKLAARLERMEAGAREGCLFGFEAEEALLREDLGEVATELGVVEAVSA